jgi:hypothetical protein
MGSDLDYYQGAAGQSQRDYLGRGLASPQKVSIEVFDAINRYLYLVMAEDVFGLLSVLPLA